MRPRSLILVLIGSLAALPTHPQHDRPRNNVRGPVNAGEVLPAPATPEGLLHLDVVVTTTAGVPVVGLPASEFTLLDNGRPIPIVSFQPHVGISADPVPVLLLLDTVRIPGPLASLERRQIEAFLRLNDGHLARPITLLLLDDAGLWRVGEPSADGNALADALAHNHRTSWASFLWAGVPDRMGRDSAAPSVAAANPLHAYAANLPPGEAGLRALGAIAAAERRDPGRKLLLWVSPALGQGSNVIPENLLRTPQQKLAAFDLIVWFSDLLRLARITLSDSRFSGGPTAAVSENSPAALPASAFAPVSGPDQLMPVTINGIGIPQLTRQALAVASGGHVFDPLYPAAAGEPNPSDLTAQLNACLRESGAFYTVTFNPPPAQQRSEYHALEIKVRESGLTAHTDTGYYGQPWYSDPPDPALRRLTVAQFDQLLHEAQGGSDGELARQIAGVVLTERPAQAQVDAWTTALPGKKSREALLGVTDLAAFLEPPPSAIPAGPPPGAGTQRQILQRAVDYVNKTIPHLPNFFARRVELNFQEVPSFYKGEGHFTQPDPLHVVDTSRTTVLFRNGEEVVDAKVIERQKKNGSLFTYGTFGPALGAVLRALDGQVVWSGWENDPAVGRLAVFRYAVPVSGSRNETSGCCLPDGDGNIPFRVYSPYHGTVAIDPATGAVLRVVFESGVDLFVPVDRAAIMIAYGPVTIGDRSYICPLRSVSLLRSRSINERSEFEGETYRIWGPFATKLDDFRFDDYHTFRARIRMILPGDSQ